MMNPEEIREMDRAEKTKARVQYLAELESALLARYVELFPDWAFTGGLHVIESLANEIRGLRAENISLRKIAGLETEISAPSS